METKDLNLENGNDLAAEVVAKKSNDEKEMKFFKKRDNRFKGNPKAWTEEEIRYYINLNHIESIVELMEKNDHVFTRTAILGIADKLGFNDADGKSLLEIIQLYIDETGIQSPKILARKSNAIEHIIDKFGLRQLLKYPTKVGEVTKFLTSVEDYQKFIYDNNIQGPKDFKERFSNVYALAEDRRFSKQLEYPVRDYLGNIVDYGPSKPVYFTNEEIFREFINRKGIKRASELFHRFPALFKKAWQIGVLSNLFPEYIDNLTAINEFVRDCELQEPRDLKKKFRAHHDYARNCLGELFSSIEYPDRLSYGFLRTFNTQEDFQNFINENDIQSPSDLNKRFPSIYRRAAKLDDVDVRDLIYPDRKTSLPLFLNNAPFIPDPNIVSELKGKSLGELLAESVLRMNNIEFEAEKTFDWLIYKFPQRIDFYIPGINLAIEIQGEQHFKDSGDKFGDSLEVIRARDLNKYNLCKEHGINIIYFANNTNSWSDKGKCIEDFFAPVLELTQKNILDEINKYKNALNLP